MKNIFRVSAAVAATLAITGWPGNAVAEGKARPLSTAERAIVELVVKESLVDPESARIEIRPFILGSDLVCGRVNSKNNMGGYTGFRAFEVRIEKTAGGAIRGGSLPEHYGWGDELSSAIMASAHCQEAGYNVPDPRPAFNR